MNQQSGTKLFMSFTRILVAVDSTPASSAALKYLKPLVHGGVTVRVVSVAENPHTLVPLGGWAGVQLQGARLELLRDADAAIQAAQAKLQGCDAKIEGQLIDLCKVGGHLVDALSNAISQWSPDLVVLGTRHHQGLLRWVEGEVSAPLARLLHAPVLIVPPEYKGATDGPPSRVLFATDGSDASLCALRAGAGLVAPRSNWRIVYVVDRLLAAGTGPFERQLEDTLTEIGRVALKAAVDELAVYGRQSERAVETALIKTSSSFDDVPHAIERDAVRSKSQLVLLGTHGRRGLARWLLGSVAERTLRLTTVPLLLVLSPRE
ncbi:universal stress protein [Paraburkholderia sp. J94]|uniref:universal stress protein n=1 Tax=Paraburkholderia sp. J94 TaxID=2805441 RepID=UPI002AB172EA|nr:universal stress protein [Paraburkholderia sp. J94]